MTSRQLRLARAASASTTATLLAAVSHSIGGGLLPHPLFVASIAVFLTPLAAFLVGARASRRRIAATVLFSQALFHVLFHLLGAQSMAGGASTPSGHDHSVDFTALLSAGPTVLPDATMLVAHVAAAVITSAILWHGEQTLQAIAKWAWRLLRRSLPGASVQHNDLPAVTRPVVPRVLTPQRGRIRRRGPPLLSRG